jgi:hypothetical protein
MELSGGKPVEDELPVEGDSEGVAAPAWDAGAAMPGSTPFDDEVRPPLDVPVDRLAAEHEAHQRAAQDAPEREPSGAESTSARDLVLPLQDDPTESDGNPRRG